MDPHDAQLDDGPQFNRPEQPSFRQYHRSDCRAFAKVSIARRTSLLISVRVKALDPVESLK